MRAGELGEGAAARQVVRLRPHVVPDRHQHRLLRLLPFAEVERDERAGVAPLRRAARQELRVVDVPEGAVERALQALGVGGVVLAHRDAPLRPGRAGAMEMQVRRVEDDAARAGPAVRFVEQAPVQILDPVGVGSPRSAKGSSGGVVGDGARGDERHARHRDRFPGNVAVLDYPAAR